MSRETCSCPAGTRTSNAEAMDSIEAREIHRIQVRGRRACQSFSSRGWLTSQLLDAWNLLPKAQAQAGGASALALARFL